MKFSMHTTRFAVGSLALGAFLLSAGSSSALDRYFAAKEFQKQMADGTMVTMWGFAEDSNANLADDHGEVPTVPGPMVSVGHTDSTLRIHLRNDLSKPVSIVMPGQEMPDASGCSAPVWTDGSTGARGSDMTLRVRSFGCEAAPAGGTQTYEWSTTAGNALAPGSYLYHSGTHPQVQVQMGLYGEARKMAGAGEAYSGVSFDEQLSLVFSEIDPALHQAVASGSYGVGGGAGGDVSFAPLADAPVNDDSPGTNYGSFDPLKADDDSTTYRSFLKFNVTGLSGPIQSAVLRLYAVNGSSDGVSVHGVSNNFDGTGTPWTEGGINWNNAPGVGGSALDSITPVPKNAFVEFDVSSAITGDDFYSFALVGNGDDSARFNSKEGTVAPELIVTTLGGGPTSTLHYVPKYFLVNGESFTPGTPCVGSGINPGDNVLVRMYNAGLRELDPMFINSRVDVIASSGRVLPFPRDQHTIHVQPTSTKDMLFSQANPGAYRIIERRLSLTDGATPDRGMQACIGVYPVGPAVQTLYATADSRVRSSRANKNYGSSDPLRADEDSTTYRSYLKFNVTGITAPVQSALLRLYVVNGTDDAIEAHSVSNAWTEGGITWNNAPPIGGASLDTLGPITPGQWIEFEVKDAITGNGDVSFGLMNTGDDGVRLNSREGGFPPELVITQ